MSFPGRGANRIVQLAKTFRRLPEIAVHNELNVPFLRVVVSVDRLE